MKKIGVGLKEVILSNIGEIVTSKNGEWGVSQPRLKL